MTRKYIEPKHYKQLLSEISIEKMCITQLADKMGFSNFAIHKMAAVLEERGHIKRVFGGNRTFLVLTNSGRKIAEGARK